MLISSFDQGKKTIYRNIGIMFLINFVLLGLFSLFKLSGPPAAILSFEVGYLITLLLSKEKLHGNLLFMNVFLTGVLSAMLYGILSFFRIRFTCRFILVSFVQIALVLLLHAKKELLFKKHTAILVIFSIILVVARLLFAYLQHPNIIPGAAHDDQLMLNLSQSLRQGKWLGSYMSLTLSKGMFFPLWMAICNLLSLPVLLANYGLYAFSCLALVIALSPILRNANAKFIIFSLLLYNPASFAIKVNRLYRDSIYSALCLLVIAGFVGLFLRRDNARKMLPYSVLGGIALLAAWNTREDTFWLLPFVASASAITLVLILFERSNPNMLFRFKRILPIMIAFSLFFSGNACIAAINKHHYGRYVRNDYTSSDFQGAYGALTRVRHENWIPDIPVPKDARAKIYEVSPAFSELKDILEDPHSIFLFRVNDDYSDYYGGWFFWALRGAAAAKGYYQTPLKAQEYFERLASEVNAACDSGKLDAVTGKRVTLSSPFTPKYIAPLIRDIGSTLKYVIYLQDVGFDDAYVEPSRELDDILAYTHSSPAPRTPSTIDRLTQETLSMILFAYQKTIPMLTFLGVFCFGALLILFCIHLHQKKRIEYFQELLILTGLLLLILLRIIMIAFVNCSSFPAIDVMYLSSVYPLLFAFNCLSISISAFKFFASENIGGVFSWKRASLSRNVSSQS